MSLEYQNPRLENADKAGRFRNRKDALSMVRFGMSIWKRRRCPVSARSMVAPIAILEARLGQHDYDISLHPVVG